MNKNIFRKMFEEYISTNSKILMEDAMAMNKDYSTPADERQGTR